MEPKNQSDHIALLSLMVVGVLTDRLARLGQLDEETSEHIRRLVRGVRIHARSSGLTDLEVLLDNLEQNLPERLAIASQVQGFHLPHH